LANYHSQDFIQTAMSEAPILVLLPAPLAPFGSAELSLGREDDPVVLGLRLTRRTFLAARRAGYSQVFFLEQNGYSTPWIAAVQDWRSLAATFACSPTAPLVVAPAAILSEVDWLKQLAGTQIEPAAWASVPNRIVMLAPASALEALLALDEETGMYDIGAAERCLARRFGSPVGIPLGIDPLVVEAPTDVRFAERRLLRSLVKETDGFMARHIERPISLRISRRLAATAVTPNQMSAISILVGLCGGPFFLSQSPFLQTIGALLFLAHSILDGCDGELARLRFQESRWGGVIDFWGDNVVHAVIFACMAVGWSRSASAPWPLWLGAAAVLGTVGAAGLVYWRLMRPKEGVSAQFTSVSTTPERPLARMLDAASRRDFIYLVLVLALVGRSNWFLLLAAIGAPIYFFLVIFLAARERLLRAPKPSSDLVGE